MGISSANEFPSTLNISSTSFMRTTSPDLYSTPVQMGESIGVSGMYQLRISTSRHRDDKRISATTYEWRKQRVNNQ